MRALAGALLACLSLTAAAASAMPRDRLAVVLWQSDLPPERLALLHGLGIDAGRVFGERDHFDGPTLRGSVARLHAAGLGAIIENVATDYYAAYHRWRGPGVAVNGPFLALLGRARAGPAAPGLWDREPGLADTAALARISRRLEEHASALRGADVLYVALGDETGIGDLSAASDLDESPAMLAAWRQALRLRYGAVAELDHAWGTHFARWSAVVPSRTDGVLAGSAPIAAWMDFHGFVDARFARDIAIGTAAVHRGDPARRAAIEGAQRPGSGGYDYARLAPAVDAMEIGEVGATDLVARGFNPSLLLLTTVVIPGPVQAERARLWRFVLLGGRAIVLWDPQASVVDLAGHPGQGAAELHALLHGDADLDGDLDGALGRRILAAEPVLDRVGILYSQASFRLRWLLDRARDHARGLDWTRRDNDADLADSPWRDALASAVSALLHAGRRPVWIDSGTFLRRGDPLAGLDAVLLPQAIALDDAAVEALRRFAVHGGRLVADVAPGRYDALGHPRRVVPLGDLVAPSGAFTDAGVAAAVVPAASLRDATGAAVAGVSIYRFDAGRLVVLARDQAGDRPLEARLSIGSHRCAVTIGASSPAVVTFPAPSC